MHASHSLISRFEPDQIEIEDGYIHLVMIERETFNHSDNSQYLIQ